MKRISLRAVSAADVARVSGVLFVFIGGCLSLALANHAFTTPVAVIEAQVATATGSGGGTGSGSEADTPPNSVDGTDAETSSTDGTEVGPGAENSGPEYDEEPEPQIVVPTQLDREVPINIFVPHATEVKLFLYEKATQANHYLGITDRVSNTHWRFELDSTQYSNGEYKLKVQIINPHKTYHRYKNPLFIENSVIEDAADTIEDSGSDTVIFESNEAASTTDSETEETETNADDINDDTAPTDDDIDATIQDDPDASVEASEEDGTESVVLNETDTEEIEATLDPVFDIDVRPGFVAAGTTEFVSTVTNVNSVEVFLKPRFGGVKRFVDRGKLIDENEWRFVFDTQNIPNGEYALILVAKNSFGSYESEARKFYVFNQVAASDDPEQIAEIKAIIAQKPLVEKIIAADNAEELNQIARDLPKVPAPTTVSPAVTDPDVSESGRSEGFMAAVELDAELSPDENTAIEVTAIEVETELKPAPPKIDRVDTMALSNEADRDELEAAVNRLVVSVRNGDDRAIERARRNLQSVKEAVKAEDPEVAEELERTVTNVESRTIRQVAVIRDRVGDDVFRDQDNDGISDYDEVHLYDTDPFVADSDGDGFVDGAEVLSGFDPKNEEPEALVAFESPKEAGLVREDILVVESITAVSVPDVVESPEIEARDRDVPAPIVAEISGKALPNSFVTLYIFSTPVIITVKTDDDGSWSYTFDKELEDGQHEVFVGITDNAGKIVAKSNPLTFVKEAQAFTPVEAAAESVAPVPVAPAAQQQSLVSEYMLLLVMSVAVVAIGLVLILLGIYYEQKAQVEPKTVV